MDRALQKRPLCPNCGEPMKLARVIAGTQDLAPLNVFRVRALRHLLQRGQPRAAGGGGQRRAAALNSARLNRFVR
jgi:hypothetical protein